MVRKLLALLVFLVSGYGVFAQVDIAVNSFEETAADTWSPLSFSTPPCTDGADQWDYDNSLSSISPTEGSQFWGIRDLEGNCGGSGYETITFPSVDVSTYTNVSVSFDYYTIGYEPVDNLGYEIWEDGIKVVDLVNLNDDSGGWISVSYNVAAGVNDVYLVLKCKQNGAGDYGAFDNVVLQGDGGSGLPTVNFDVVSATVAENGTSYIIQATSSATGTHTVDIAVAGGTATNGNEYSYTATSLDFTGSTTAIATVTINDNTVCAGNTNVVFELTNNVDCDLGTNDELVLTINDDEFIGGALRTLSFETGDTWGYTGGGNLASVTNTFYGTQSYEINSNQILETDNVAISGFSNVTVAVAFAARTVETSDELYLDISYDGGSTWSVVHSTLLMNGYSNASLDIGSSTPSNANAFAISPNPYIVNVPASEAQIKVRIRVEDATTFGDNFYVDDIILSGEACNTCSEPTAEGSMDPVTTFDETTATLSWSSGDGLSRIVAMKEGSAVVGAPVDGNTYSADANFGGGDEIATNEEVVYNGSGTSVNVTGLTPGTQYFASLFEYNCLPGAEDYLASTISTDFITNPIRPEPIIEGCVSNSSIELSWSAPPNGDWTGYVLVARQGAAPSGTIDNNAPSSYAGDLDWGAAQVYNGTSRVLYVGSLNNVTVTGLTAGISYTFHLYSYTEIGSDFVYSLNNRQTTQVIDQVNIENEAGIGTNESATIQWTNPSSTCFDDVLVVVTAANGITFSPVGTSYTGDPAYSSPDHIAYFGDGNNITITGLTNGTTYYVEIFVLNGTDWSSGVEVQVTPTTATIFEPGDMAVIGVNASRVEGGDPIDDFYIVFFKDITPNTSIDFTDNGYERSMAGFWGDSEGVIRMTYTGAVDIPAGQIIRIITAESGQPLSDMRIEMDCVDVTSDWSIIDIGAGGLNLFALNQNDQLWVMQGGNWSQGTGANHDGSYIGGNILYGWTASGWEVAPGYNDSQGSTVPPGLLCFTANLDFSANGERSKYNDVTTPASKREWITRFYDESNWDVYANTEAYDAGPNFCGSFDITGTTFTVGEWQGEINNDWYECGNWSDLKLPDPFTDVLILASAPNDAVIDRLKTGSPSIYYQDQSPTVGSLTIQSGAVLRIGDVNHLGEDSLAVIGDVYLEDGAVGDVTTLQNSNGGLLEVGELLYLEGEYSRLDMNSFVTNPSRIILSGDWENENSSATTDDGFYENNSIVTFVGASDRYIYKGSGLETFHDLIIDKPGSEIDQAGIDAEVKGRLTFVNGVIKTGAGAKLHVSNVNPNSIAGYPALNNTGTYVNDRYVQGRLERSMTTANNYDFPIGGDPNIFGYHPVNLANMNTNAAISAEFMESGPGLLTIYDNTQICGGSPRTLNYDDFAHNGFWNLAGPSLLTYQISLHPNAATNPDLPASPGVYHSEFRVLKSPSGTAGDGANWPAASAYDGDICTVTSYYDAEAIYTGFSDFAIMGDDFSMLLPIELLSFQAKVQNKDIRLDWTTATETNNDYFELYHSQDGQNWEKINQQVGAGNNTVSQYYDYLHLNPGGGKHYYKLRQVDYDGQFTESDVVWAELDNRDNFSLYPVPSSEYLFIRADFNIAAQHITVVNDRGQKISNWSLDDGQMNISRLSDGIYFITLTSGNATVTRKFVKISG